MSKQELRMLMLNNRRLFAGQHKHTADQKIQEQALTLINAYQTIGIYLNMQEEVSTKLIIDSLRLANKVICGPKCVGSELEFRVIDDPAALKPGMLGIMEPTGELIAKEHIQVLLIPLVAFDQNLNRLGYGKGYYDRYLAGFHGLKIGLAYQLQSVESIRTDEHDIALDYIITENSLIQANQSSKTI